MQEMQKMWVWSLGQEDPVEEEMAIHCSILAWEIPWTEEPGGLQSMGLPSIGHDGAHMKGRATDIQSNLPLYLPGHHPVLVPGKN